MTLVSSVTLAPSYRFKEQGRTLNTVEVDVSKKSWLINNNLHLKSMSLSEDISSNIMLQLKWMSHTYQLEHELIIIDTLEIHLSHLISVSDAYSYS